MPSTRRLSALCATSIVFLSAAAPSFAADFGVLTSVDVCDSLGVSGLTLSSGDACLKISGEVEYVFRWGNYDRSYRAINDLKYSSGPTIFLGNGALDWDSELTSTLTFDASSASDFGVARGVITLEGKEEIVFENLALDSREREMNVDEAYIAIGDKTVLMAGIKDTIAKTGNDTSFTFQQLFHQNRASGVGFNANVTGTDIDTDGHVIQVTTDLGNGVTAGAALEDLDDLGTLVGVVTYKSDMLDGHVTVLADEVLSGMVNDWAIHAGLTADLGDYRVRGALAANNDGWWNVLGTADAEFDIFTLATGVEATSEDEFGAAASVSVELDAVTVNVGSRMFREFDGDVTIDTGFEVEYEMSATITLVAGGGYIHESDRAAGITYGEASLEWAPSRNFDTELTGRVHSRPGDDLGYRLSFTATKSFE
ncbi:Porin subfamily protein [Devosia lucknowensis]|uniref:Porin n=1 Tax=Devosia lucknowensis TaxID=1096929 RepID=A0A1Y6F1G0_9HYPH|nr:porin [Devosia lucknowensis]SMQ68674.1 Porin subfamily protein [Devosia lucknowensis]